ncbi:MAG: DUF5106 domain-containing protein [Firmicutes bacterium]|nr:DUF5106 domain-containing protein [Bacillota bacterium]MCM1401215.1 DUF5106 domain-containing protein [Bacteroides sp.]
MKHLIISLLTLISSLGVMAQVNGAVSQQFFQLPIIPDSIENFQRRCDYMVTHYWDFCDLKKAFSSRDKMAQAFDTYISFMPYASADAVYASVDKFMGDISKNPDNVLFITRLAEGSLYADTAQYQSEELYTRFLDNALKVKKLDKDARTHFQQQANILHNSQEGMTAPEFDYVTLDGVKGHFAPDSTQFATVIMFTKPGNSYADMAKLRLYADIKTSQLVESGLVKIICMALNDDNGALTESKGWITGYAPEAANVYDLRVMPMFYIINSKGKILKKSPEFEPLLAVMQQLRVPKKKAVSEPAPQVPVELAPASDNE